MKLNDNFVVREIMGEFILVPVCADDNVASLITINETGKDIINLIPKSKNDEDIIVKMQEIYDTDENELRNDVTEFLTKLRELEVLVDD